MVRQMEEWVTPISFIIRNMGKQVVYICIKKMSIDLQMAAKAWKPGQAYPPRIHPLMNLLFKSWIRC